MKKILIAIDDGPTSKEVASAGLQLAVQLGTEIALVSVVDTLFIMTDGFVTHEELAEVIKKDLLENQKALADEFFKDHTIQTFVAEGNPVDMILKVAEEWEADLIVLGTHGRTGLDHLLMGSVAEKVVRHSTKPLFVVPTTKKEPKWKQQNYFRKNSN